MIQNRDYLRRTMVSVIGQLVWIFLRFKVKSFSSRNSPTVKITLDTNFSLKTEGLHIL